jgi:glycosyltransferase involved in cell wall biosynthesis
MKRIGVAFPGNPCVRTTWSGTPSGIMRGLTEAGAMAIPINTEPPRVVRDITFHLATAAYLRPARDLTGAARRARRAARASTGMAAVTSWAAPRAIRQAGPLDGIVQIGTSYGLTTDVPVVTFEDMTVAQMRRHPYAGWDMLSARAFDARVARQKAGYELAVACCMATPWAAESVIEDYGIAPEKVHVVGVGRNHTVSVAARDWSRPRFLFVGMGWEHKNGPAVVEAFARLREGLPEAQLDIVGTHPRLDLPGVTGHGVLRLDVEAQRRQLARLFATATCFLMPSWYDAAGIAYVEAATAGLPSIGTRNGGPSYLIGNGGVVVDPADHGELLAQMRRLADPVTAAGMGAAAKARSERFTWAAVAARLLRALDGTPAEAEAAIAA